MSGHNPTENLGADIIKDSINIVKDLGGDAIPFAIFVGIAGIFFKSGIDSGSSTFVQSLLGTSPNLPAVGLKNPNNWCYMNSTLQALSSCTLFVQYIKDATKRHTDAVSSPSYPYLKVDDDEGIDDKAYLAKSLCKILKDLNNPKKYASQGTTAKKLVEEIGKVKPEFQTDAQQDAHEFLGLLIDLFQLDTELLKQPSGKNSGGMRVDFKMELPKKVPMIHFQENFQHACQFQEKAKIFQQHPLHMPIIGKDETPLHGKIASSLICRKCSYRKKPTITPSICLSLSLLQSNGEIRDCSFGTKRGSIALEDCLEGHFKEEIADDVDCDGCALCYKLLCQDEDEEDRNETQLRKLERRNLIQEQRVKQLNIHITNYTYTNNSSTDNDTTTATLTTAPNSDSSLNAWHEILNQKHDQPKYFEYCRKVKEDRLARQKQPGGYSKKFKQQHTKQLSIAKLPPILCIHLQRKHYDQYGRKKLTEHVEFKEEWELQHQLYRLQSVVEHHGSFFGGHYTMYRRNEYPIRKKKKDGEEKEEEKEEKEEKIEWSRISDSYCSAANWEDVASCKAYMLFYQQIEVEENQKFNVDKNNNDNALI